MSANNKWAHVHAEVAELAAEIGKEPLDDAARAARLEKRRRQQDEPARRAYANQALALRFFVQFCGYDPSVKDTLNAAIEAVAGLDHPITRVDWEMGLYLRGGTEQEAERVRALPAKHAEKVTLAKAWTRAYAEYKAEEKRTGIVALRRTPGTKDFKTGKGRGSKIYAPCAQDIVEITTAAAKIPGKRFERFARAAREHVEMLSDNPARCALNERERETKPGRIQQPDTPALLMVRALSKVEKLAEELKRELPPEMHGEMLEHLTATLRQKLGPEETVEIVPEADSVHLLSNQERWTKSDENAPAENIQNAHIGNTEPAKNAAPVAPEVDNLSTIAPHICPSPAVEPELIEERVFIMCESGDVSETEAAEVARRDLCEACRVRRQASDNPTSTTLLPPVSVKSPHEEEEQRE